jgi:peptidoglycan/LPS O-acetylase OafA/YrhL
LEARLNPSSDAGPPRRLDLGVLDALRGLTALYVVLHHAEWLLWSPALGAASGVGKLGLTIATSSLLFGHQAVLIFFLISGFCIHHSQAKRLATGAAASNGRKVLPLDLSSYAWRRARRLVPPLVLALVFTAALDQVGAAINPAFYAGQSPIESINTSLIGVSDHSPFTLLGNLVLQPSLAVPTFGTDTPLWSLGYEFWYYALYPVLLLISLRFGIRGMVATTALVSAIALAAVLSHTLASADWAGRVLSYWVVWTAGALIAEAYVGRMRIPGARRIAPTAVLLAVGVCGILAYNELRPKLQLEQHVEDLLWSGAFAVMLSVGILACPRLLRRPIERASRWLSPLGNVSYSLYVVHMPWLALLSAWWLSSHSELPASIAMAAVGVAGALSLAGACWFLVERHCVSRRSTTGARQSRLASATSEPALT